MTRSSSPGPGRFGPAEAEKPGGPPAAEHHRGAHPAIADQPRGLLTVSTDFLDQRERFDFWREVICGSFVELDARPLGEAERFHCSGASVAAGSISLSRISSAPHLARRTPATIARADEHYFQLALVLDGTGMLVQDERTAVLRPGDFALFETARPFTMQFERDHEMFVLMVPHSVFRAVLPRASAATAIGVDGEETTATLLRPLFDSLLRTADTASPAMQQHLTTAALELVAASLAERTSLSTESSMSAAHLTRAKDYIQRNLRDAELSPETIAHAVSVSPRYLHALFRDNGTSVSRYLKACRLDRAHSDLVDPRWAHVPVADIAIRLGFKCPKHFAKVFKAQFGFGPREHRSRGR